MILIANMAQLIKKAAIEAVEASKPSDLIFGKVIKTNPLSVNVDQKLTLNEEFVYATYAYSKIMQDNDNVVMIRAKGGQKYLIIDKVV
ncbi:Protein of unknown function [Anaerosporobacter mobilis DSM 15930]|uniref:DUF2577 domain-containing protein n=2 Tax=Anaerosporobacter TaxID=653683 RepID=A0A1M7MWU8_9FIRM|nr:Protein of unknown function [Anaerosporobacter mobilis DSM 15930]